MSECLNEATCSPKPSQAFPAPLPSGIPADVITYAFDGDCPTISGLDGCTPGSVSSVSQALDAVEDALCSLNPKGIKSAPNCSPIVVRNGVATPVTALEALNCLPDGKPGDVPIFNGSDWVIGPILLEPSDCEYPCPPAADLILTSTGVNTATWQSPKVAPPLVQDTATVDMSVSGSVISSDVRVSTLADNILEVTPSGLYVPASEPIGCADILPLLAPVTGCFPDKLDSPTRVLSSGLSGIGYRNLPSLSDLTTVSDTPSLDLTMTGANVSGTVKISAAIGNRVIISPDGLYVPPIGCTELAPLLDPTTGCFPAKVTDPTSVLSIGSDGLGYRPLPSGATPTIVNVTDTSSLDLTLGGTASNPNISGVVIISPNAGNVLTSTPNGLFVPTPSGGGTSTVVSVADTQTIDMVLGGTATAPVVSANAIIDPALGNKLSASPSGLLVLPQTCAETLTSLKTTLTGGCLTTAAVCALPTALMGHQGGNPQYFSGKPLYHAEVYPLSNAAQQTLSNVGSTLNDITSLMTLVAGDENGLCPGEAGFWDAAMSRFTITRPGRYTYHFGLFMRLIMSNSTGTANNSLYAGVRFIRPAGTVNGRTVSAQASTLRGTQFTIATVTAPAQTQDWESIGSHTFIATAGTQLSLRAVAILGSGSAITSFVVRGDSGHFSLSELADRQF